MRTAARIGFSGIYLLSLALVAFTIPTLPDPLASRLGAGGRAHGAMSREAYGWLLLGLSGLLPLAMIGAFSWLPRRIPRLANLPNRAVWLEPENRPRLHARMDRAGLLLATSTALFLAAIHWLILKANLRYPARLDNGPFFALLVVFLAITLGTSLGLSLSLRKGPAATPRR